MDINEVRQWETIVSQTKESELNISGSIIKKKEETQYAIIGFPYNSCGEMMFLLNEYDINMNPRCGICSYVLTKEELENNFIIVGKYKR